MKTRSTRSTRSIIVAGFGLALALGSAWWLGQPASEAESAGVHASAPRHEPPESKRAWARVREAGRAGRAPTPSLVIGHVIGHVVDREEGPLAEGSVALGCSDGSSLGRARIDEEGWFEAPACPRSRTCAQLIHPGSVQSRAWELVAGEPSELEVDPAPRLAGLVSARGRAIAAAQIVVRRGDRRWTSSTDLEGGFTIALAESAPVGSVCEFEASTNEQAFAVLVLARGHRPWAATIPAGGDDALIVALAEPAPPLTGRLSDSEGRGFDRARLLAISNERPDEGHVARPDLAGRFEFGELGEGVYQLRALRDGIELARAVGEAGADVVMGSTLSARGPTLELQLRDREGEPLPGVRVDGGPFVAAHSDEVGRVVASDVFPGTYELRLRLPEFDCGVSRERIEVPAGERDPTIRIDLALGCEPET